MGVTHSQVKSIVETEINHASKKVATPPPQEWTYKQSADSPTHGLCSEGDKGAILYCGVETKGNRVRQSDLVQLRPNCGKDKGWMVNRNDFNQVASLCKSKLEFGKNDLPYNSKPSQLYCSGVERVINLDAPGTVQENSNVGRTPNMEYVHPLVLNCLKEDFLKHPSL